MIQASNIDGTTYYSATARGVEYTAHLNAVGWFVSSRRIALGRSNIGSGRYYASLTALAAGCKAFASLDILVAATS